MMELSKMTLQDIIDYGRKIAKIKMSENEGGRLKKINV
jgi:Rrf2 family iron-sulfur cluster assembly transcriptional regulator